MQLQMMKGTCSAQREGKKHVTKAKETGPVERLRGRCRKEDIIKRNIKERDVNIYTEFECLRVGIVSGCCEHSNEHRDSIKAGSLVTRRATDGFLPS
jgi:hypothetical protein